MKNIQITSEQVDKITKALNREEMDTGAVVRVVRQQIKEQGDCSPILAHLKPAIISGSPAQIELAMHELRSIWRLAQWKYAEFSRWVLKENA